MAKNVYEAMFIFDSNRFARDPAGAANQVTALVQKFGGEILASRLWEERRLAYPINGQRKGTYWLTYFRLESKSLSDFNREMQLNESILRSLTLKVDARIVDALVSHALQSPQDIAKAKRAEAAAAIEAMPEIEEVEA